MSLRRTTWSLAKVFRRFNCSPKLTELSSLPRYTILANRRNCNWTLAGNEPWYSSNRAASKETRGASFKRKKKRVPRRVKIDEFLTMVRRVRSPREFVVRRAAVWRGNNFASSYSRPRRSNFRDHFVIKSRKAAPLLYIYIYIYIGDAGAEKENLIFVDWYKGRSQPR